MNHLLRRMHPHQTRRGSSTTRSGAALAPRPGRPQAGRLPGPHGWEHSPTKLGRITARHWAERGGDRFSAPVLPLVEVRATSNFSGANPRRRQGRRRHGSPPARQCRSPNGSNGSVAVSMVGGHHYGDCRRIAYEPSRLGEAPSGYPRQWQTPSIRSSGTGSAGRTGWRWAGANTAGWWRQPNTGATHCSNTSGRSWMGHCLGAGSGCCRCLSLPGGVHPHSGEDLSIGYDSHHSEVVR